MFAAHLVLTIQPGVRPARTTRNGGAGSRPARDQGRGRATPHRRSAARPSAIAHQPVRPPLCRARARPPRASAAPATRPSSRTPTSARRTTSWSPSSASARRPPRRRKPSSRLIEKLGDKDAGSADKAEGELTAIGPAAVPRLAGGGEQHRPRRGRDPRQSSASPNIEGPAAANLVTHAARLLATRKPAGGGRRSSSPTCPSPRTTRVLAEIEARPRRRHRPRRQGRPGRPQGARRTRAPVRRGAAASALCKAGGTAFHAEIRPLLKDAAPLGPPPRRARPRQRLRRRGHPRAHRPARPTSPRPSAPPSRNSSPASPASGPSARRQGRRRPVAPPPPRRLGRLVEERRRRRPARGGHAAAPSPNDDREKLHGLIKKLGDADAETREAASDGHHRHGQEGRPHAAPGRRRPATPASAPSPPSASRRSTRTTRGRCPPPRRACSPCAGPRGPSPALVAYLPFAESPDMQAQIVEILAAIGCPAGKADPALVKALGDAVAVRRACVGRRAVQGQGHGPAPRAARSCSTTRTAQVVLRTACGLASMGQKESIPALIGLLKDLPIEQAWDVEEFLDRIAGDKAPAVTLTADAAGRAKAVEAWNKWWKENGKGDRPRQARPRPAASRGVYLVVEQLQPSRRHAAASSRSIRPARSAGRSAASTSPTTPRCSATATSSSSSRRTASPSATAPARSSAWTATTARCSTPSGSATATPSSPAATSCMVLDPKGTPGLHAPLLRQHHPRRPPLPRRQHGLRLAHGHYVKLDAAGKQIKSMNLNWSGRSAVGADIAARRPGRAVATRPATSSPSSTPDGKLNWEVLGPRAPQPRPDGRRATSS